MWPEKTPPDFFTSGQLETFARGSEGAECSLPEAEEEKEKRGKQLCRYFFPHLESQRNLLFL